MRILVPCAKGCGALIRKANKTGLCQECFRAENRPEHGTYNCYDKHRCRCDLCRAANAARHLEARRRRRQAVEAGTVVITKHGTSTYTNWGCRCEVCIKAQAQACAPAVDRYKQNHPDRVKATRMRRYRKEQAETLERATRHRYVWTGPEMELAARYDLSAKEIALMIGRTSSAVQHMRKLLIKDPKIIQMAGLARRSG
jgi:hypothetical protein